jgi:capsular exopolysaccharide synthesis family protein
MSQIFDALQRAEAERAGVKISALPSATELLEYAERRASAKWDTVVSTEPSKAGAGARTGGGRGPQEPVQASEGNGTASAGEAPTGGELSEIFSQFASLSISLPAQSRVVSLSDKDSPAAEAFRLLGVRLRHLRRDRALKKLLITSTIPQEGKSMVSANLSCSLALRADQRVVLVEGDVRRPSLSQKFGLEARQGLCEWLRGERELAQSIYHLDTPGLWIVPAGDDKNNPLELLQTGKVAVLLEQLSSWFDWVIIDSPPVLPLADTSVWARAADGILLVTRRGTTEKRQLERGLEALESQKLIGAVLNHCADPDHSDYYYSSRTSGIASDH